MELRKIIATTIREYLNEEKKTKTNLNDNFWKWFSDSKIVDNNGNPIIVYHATKNDFKSFSFKNSLQKIIWFTNDVNAIKNKEVGAVQIISYSLITCMLIYYVTNYDVTIGSVFSTYRYMFDFCNAVIMMTTIVPEIINIKDVIRRLDE